MANTAAAISTGRIVHSAYSSSVDSMSAFEVLLGVGSTDTVAVAVIVGFGEDDGEAIGADVSWHWCKSRRRWCGCCLNCVITFLCCRYRIRDILILFG